VTAGVMRAFIAREGLTPGDRLPPERALIDLLDLKRTSLRKALEVLEREGAIRRHVGRGTFIASAEEGALPNPDLSDLAAQLTPVRMMRARLCIEPAIAREAAINASGEAIRAIREAQQRAERAPTWERYEAEDDALHRAIARASDNLLLVRVFDQISAVRRAVTWGNVERKTERPPANHPSFDQHRAILSAIEEHDPQRAHDTMRPHIGEVSARLFGEVYKA
jgi:Transcriptional regulators